MRHPVFSDKPQTSTERSRRHRQFLKEHNRSSNFDLPASAYSSLRLLCNQVGLSVPGLLLAAVELLKDVPHESIKAAATRAARRHGLRIHIEQEDGTRTRVAIGPHRGGDR